MSSITCLNQTNYIAQFVLARGGLTIAHPVGIAPGASLQVPIEDTFQIVATTVIDGNTYTSAPFQVSGAAGFLAQIVQVAKQGTYEFNVREMPATVADQLQFQKTCLSPVTFTISRNRTTLQSVVVQDSFMMQTIDIGNTINVYAVVNGITTAVVSTSDFNATITLHLDTSDLESGYFTLATS